MGVTPEGYPQYESVREASFVLTSSDVGNKSFGASLSVAKTRENSLNWSMGYAYTDAQDVSPMTSSVAFSNYQNRAFFDPQEQVLSTSNYNIKHRLTVSASYGKNFFSDYETTYSIISTSASDRPYSHAFKGTVDPFGFTPILDFRTNVLEPSTERNSEEGSSWTKVDFKVEQEIPSVRRDDRASAFLVIDNLTNFINDGWGVLYEASFPRTIDINDDSPESRVGDASRYEIRVGIKYTF